MKIEGNSGVLRVVGVGRWSFAPMVLGARSCYFKHKEHQGCTKDTKPNDRLFDL